MHVRSSVALLAAMTLAGCASGSRGRGAAATAPAPAAQLAIRPQSDGDAIDRIVREGTERSHVAADLEHLTDVIGPRLAGTPEFRRAVEWTRDKFRDYGADSAWIEPWKFGVGWERGPMTLTMLEPQHRQMIAYSWAWSPGTNGPLAGDVVFVNARSEDAWRDNYAGKLRGKWVLLGPASPVTNPDGPALSHADSVHLDSLRRAQFQLTPEERAFTARRNTLLAQEGIAGVIQDGAKDFDLLTMSGSPESISPYPRIVIPNGDYAQMQRVLTQGLRVRVEADIHNTIGRDTLDQWNTVAEIRGSEKPDEVVLLGGHLDSWDLGTGATDNGTGSIAVLEAMRILKASGVKPRRTIRFALFGGEEEGLDGSEAYVQRHKGELSKYQAVLVLDNGSGRVTGMALQGYDELKTLWESLFAPVSQLGPFAVRSGNKGGTDHLSFLPYGVPGFNYDQMTRGYNHTHHSQVDIYDHAVPSDITQAATVMAATAYELANLPELLPRKVQRGFRR